MERYYIHNLETDKLNIFTGGKSDWLTIPEADRERIKSACLWSRSMNGWVSRCKGGMARFYAEDVLKRNGFENRGTEGQKLSFVEQVEAKQEKAAERAERFEDRAEAAGERSESLYNHAHTMASAIPFGQPILVGHYSEKRDRNYRERIHNTFGKAFEESDKAKHYASRAATARATAEGAQYSNPRYLGNRIKELEAEVRVIENRLQGKFYHYSEAQSISEEQREHYNSRMAEVQEKLGFFRHCLETCGSPLFSKEELKGKQAVKVRGYWYPIVRLNPKTVSVPNTSFATEELQVKWPLKYQYTEVQEAK
jgi:hypothetical protein